MCLSLAHAFTYIDEYPDLLHDVEQIAELIHDGWCINYLYWRDHKPWLKAHDGDYKRPSKSLGDARRDLCAKQSYSELDEDEKEKDRIIALFIQQELEVLD